MEATTGPMDPRQCCPTNHGDVRYGLSANIYCGVQRAAVGVPGGTNPRRGARWGGPQPGIEYGVGAPGGWTASPQSMAGASGERREPGRAAVFVWSWPLRVSGRITEALRGMRALTQCVQCPSVVSVVLASSRRVSGDGSGVCRACGGCHAAFSRPGTVASGGSFLPPSEEWSGCRKVRRSTSGGSRCGWCDGRRGG
jgi:hypothetical protein